MPPHVARRVVTPPSGSATRDNNAASHKLTNFLRHHSSRIAPSNTWWVRNVEYLYNLVLENDKQRFQRAVTSIDHGGPLREAT
eukprot:3805302-Heterocapsa_arctica.AAC.1